MYEMIPDAKPGKLGGIVQEKVVYPSKTVETGPRAMPRGPGLPPVAPSDRLAIRVPFGSQLDSVQFTSNSEYFTTLGMTALVPFDVSPSRVILLDDATV
jgi:hypothetical protein